MKKKLLLIILCALFVVPANAVFNERNITRTISVLRHELHIAWLEKSEQEKRNGQTSQMSELQHQNLVNTVKWINELTLILYSQENGFTLDQSYAMEGIMGEYERINKRRQPKFTSIDAIDAEIGRYQRLIESLKLLPPRLEVGKETPTTSKREDDSSDDELESINFVLDSLLVSFKPDYLLEEVSDSISVPDSKKNLLLELALSGRNSRKEAADTSADHSYILPVEAQADRDSCIAYASSIIGSYIRLKESIQEDEYYFSEMSRRLNQIYEDSKARYAEIQKYIFITGQEKYFFILANLKKYAFDTANDMERKYGSGDLEQDKEELRESQWRGFGLAGTVIYSFSHLLLLSLIVFLVCCVFLKKVKPFNTEWFRQTRPVVILLAISIIYSLIISVNLMFPMSNAMSVGAWIALIYFWIVIALLLSILISLKKEEVRGGFKLFLPVLLMGLLIMFCRAMFMPDKMIHLLLSPILLCFLVWQIHVNRKYSSITKNNRGINRLLTITSVVFGLSLLLAIEGYSLLALMFVMWWIFQEAALATLVAVFYLLRYFEKTTLSKMKERYAASCKMVSTDEDGDYIRVTWLFDFIDRALLPIAGILSILGCIWLASGVFNLTETCQIIFHKPFFDFKNADGNQILQVSLYKLVSTCALFFFFRYLNYLTRSIYRINRYENVMKASGNEFIRRNDINLTLAYNVIGIIIWGLFIFYAIYILRIPIGAISIVAAGLATGIGLALKDVLNNFIYGIQLMSGRLRVGDIVECDGIRGTVEKISYQSTEIQTLSGAVISITNSTLFNKNFQNLTKNSPYEYLSVVVSISYGEDVGKVRDMILEAMKDFTKKKDKYGRYLIEHKGGIRVTFDAFCDSSVNIAIKQNVLAEQKFGYAAEVKELVYKLFNEKGIVIPFPQQEVSILNFPKE